MAVFDGVHYILSPSLPPSRRHELASILDLNGATSAGPHTHLIALGGSYSHHDKQPVESTNANLKVVSDKWVDRSIVMGKIQSEQYYSPDPAMIFSGTVACATDLPASDVEVLSAGITALGGQWRIGLTRDVTHLFALRPGSDKYNTALHFASHTHMSIVTPHWFDDSVRLGRRLPETPYLWPDPVVLRPGAVLTLDEDGINNGDWKRKRPRTSDITGDDFDLSGAGEKERVWDGRKVLLSRSLELSESQRGAVEAGIKRSGGVVVKVEGVDDDEAEERAVDMCDVFVTRWRSGKAYFKAARASRLIGTLTWLFSVESTGTLHSPLDSLLWYPVPRGGIPGLAGCEISITNYTGTARDYLKRLIALIGAKFTPSLSMDNKVLIAGFQPSPKTTRALAWSIPVVNHTWLEDCVVEWRALTVGLERYVVFPPGIDFGKILMNADAGGELSSV
ncbi:BRCT domain-containing protein [Pisolithus albus]|nr:BRCT domain-containing protein [Pisolithus albus]